MRLSFKAEIQPTPTQRQALLQHAGNARWAYNWGLRQCKTAYAQWVELAKPAKWDGWRSAIDLHRDLNARKKLPAEEGGVPWMYEASKAAPQEALRNLDTAFKKFLSKKARYPRFKSRNRGIGGFRLTANAVKRKDGTQNTSIRVDRQTIQLPVIGRVRFQPGEKGYIPFGKYTQVSVREEAGRWFVSVTPGPKTLDPEGNPLGEKALRPLAKPNGKKAVGLDMGVARLATLSDGTVIENPKALAKGQEKIKRLQREVSRKKRGSSNRGKAKANLARAHARVRNVRRDALHKITTKLTKSHGLVVIEDLRVKNMTKGGGSRKRGLNRVLLDAALGEFRRLMEYKGPLYGCEIPDVPAPYTSQECSACGHVEKGNRTSQAEFRCLDCGFEINADLNAAINILASFEKREAASLIGLLKNACGEDVRPSLACEKRQTSVKQEPGRIGLDRSDRGTSRVTGKCSKGGK